jgi:hypothetical protein
MHAWSSATPRAPLSLLCADRSLAERSHWHGLWQCDYSRNSCSRMMPLLRSSLQLSLSGRHHIGRRHGRRAGIHVALLLALLLLALLRSRLQRWRRTVRAAVQTPEPSPIAELPEEIVARILVGYPSENLLEHLAICGQVCMEWWRLVEGHPAYGRGMWKRDEAMRQISRALMLGGPRNLRQRLVLPIIGGDEAGCALGELLEAMPAPLCYTEFEMRGPLRSTHMCPELTAKGMRSIARGIQSGLCCEGGALWKLDVDNNRGLGSAGIAVLAAALPPTLAVLGIARTGCGDDGMIALADALPRTCIEALDCGWNPMVRSVGWSALFNALERLPHLRTLWISDCGAGLGDAGAQALATCLPVAAGGLLEELTVGACDIGDAGALALAAVLPSCIQLKRLELCRRARRRRVRQRIAQPFHGLYVPLMCRYASVFS